MDLKANLKKWSFLLIIIGCIQFIILTAIAMIFYQGGTYINPLTSHYDFWYNVFSDLGRTTAHSGDSNVVSFIIFTFTLSLWGILQIPFYIAFPSFFKNSNGVNKFSIAGSLIGILNGVFYVGIAFTPSDILNPLHEIFVVIGFSSIFLSNFLYFMVIFKNNEYPKFYATILAISATIIGIYSVVILIFDNQTPAGLLIYVIGQKIMIYYLLICNILQGYGALKQLSS